MIDMDTFSINSSRRIFLKKSGALALGTVIAASFNEQLLAGTVFIEKITGIEDGKFSLDTLPYAYDALEPHIDKLTMEIHYSKHHQAYVNNLNKALESVDAKLLPDHRLGTIFKHISKVPVAVRNNAGGHYNYTLFWSLMRSDGGGELIGFIAEEIKKQFGLFAEFKTKFWK